MKRRERKKDAYLKELLSYIESYKLRYIYKKKNS